MVQQLHQMVLQESVPVHGPPVPVLVAPELQQEPRLAVQQVVLALPRLAVQQERRLVVLELLQQAAPELPQPVEQLPLLSVQTLE
jgi:hypothetical protein